MSKKMYKYLFFILLMFNEVFPTVAAASNLELRLTESCTKKTIVWKNQEKKDKLCQCLSRGLVKVEISHEVPVLDGKSVKNEKIPDEKMKEVSKFISQMTKNWQEKHKDVIFGLVISNLGLSCEHKHGLIKISSTK